MPELSFRELQQLAEAEYSIEDTRSDLNRLVEWFKQRDFYEPGLDSAYVFERKLKKETAYEHDVFWVDESLIMSEFPDEFKAEALGFVYDKKYFNQLGRLVYPVKDVRGNVMGLCGWDPFVKPKYLDSVNHGYKAKATTLYGMEKLPEYYTNNKKVFVTEGIVDTHWLRENEFQALAALGSHLTKYVIEILRRFGDRLIVLPDNDEAGNSFVKQVKYFLPKASVIQCKDGKDVDGYRKLNDGEFKDQILTDLHTLVNIPFLPTESFIVR